MANEQKSVTDIMRENVSFASGAAVALGKLFYDFVKTEGTVFPSGGDNRGQSEYSYPENVPLEQVAYVSEQAVPSKGKEIKKSVQPAESAEKNGGFLFNLAKTVATVSNRVGTRVGNTVSGFFRHGR